MSILKEADAGRPVNEIWRSYGISSATYYKWKAKYGGLEASDIQRLKELEQENCTLKRLYADMALENAALKDVIAKNSNACCAAGSRYPSGDSMRPSGAAGVSGDWPRSSHLLSADHQLGPARCPDH